jgi:hypothetical protein
VTCNPRQPRIAISVPRTVMSEDQRAFLRKSNRLKDMANLLK